MKNMLKSITMSLVVGSLFACNFSKSDRTKEAVLISPPIISDSTPIRKYDEIDFVDVGRCDSTFIIVMPYATENNFLNEKIYPCAKCLLRKDAAEALLEVQKTAMKKGYKIVLYDCYRPLPMQQKMFDIKPDTKYVADPKRGSKHNKGVAVDISLADMDGKPLDMGTEFDNFSEKASYHSTTVSAEAKKNRKLLRELMLANDFTPYDNEWWHFNYKKTDYPNEDFVWDCDE